MTKYQVYVTRKYVHSANIIIEAKNPREAHAKALEEIGDTELSLEYGEPEFDTAEVIGTVK